MPRYYCDYCDTYLTHDSPSVRKQHNAGYRHKYTSSSISLETIIYVVVRANIRSYYQKFEEQQTQILIDQKIKEHLGQTVVYQQIGAAYNQHLAAFPGTWPRLPVMPPPMFPGPPQMVPGIRPPMLPIPVPGAPGYGNSTMAPMQPPPAPSLPPQTGGLPPPPSTSTPSPVPGGPGGGQPSSSSGAPPNATQMFNVNPPGTSATSATAGGYSYPQYPQTGH